MVRHRKKKVQEKKKMTKWNIILPLILGAAGTGIAFGVNYFVSGPPPITRCVESDALPFDQDAFLYVTLDGEPFNVPSNVGITADCLRPVHTHENDVVEEEGVTWTRVHTSYLKPTRFTLSDFVNLWGIDLDKYNVKVFEKKPHSDSFSEVEDIRSLVLTDDIRIKMELTTIR